MGWLIWTSCGPRPLRDMSSTSGRTERCMEVHAAESTNALRDTPQAFSANTVDAMRNAVLAAGTPE